MKYKVKLTQAAQKKKKDIIDKYERYLRLYKHAEARISQDPNSLSLYSSSQNPLYRNKYKYFIPTCILVILIVEKDDIHQCLTIIDIEVDRDPDCIILDEHS